MSTVDQNVEMHVHMQMEREYMKKKSHLNQLVWQLGSYRGPTLGTHAYVHSAHGHGFWVGMGAILLFMGGHGWGTWDARIELEFSMYETYKVTNLEKMRSLQR